MPSLVNEVLMQDFPPLLGLCIMMDSNHGGFSHTDLHEWREHMFSNCHVLWEMPTCSLRGDVRSPPHCSILVHCSFETPGLWNTSPQPASDLHAKAGPGEAKSASRDSSNNRSILYWKLPTQTSLLLALLRYSSIQ